MPTDSSHHPQEVLSAQFGLYVQKRGLKLLSFVHVESNLMPHIHWYIEITHTHITDLTVLIPDPGVISRITRICNHCMAKSTLKKHIYFSMHDTNVDLLLGQRHRRRTSINTSSVQCLGFLRVISDINFDRRFIIRDSFRWKAAIVNLHSHG